MLRGLFYPRWKQQAELSELIRKSDRFTYNEQDEDIQSEARECLRAVYKLMRCCRPLKDSCHPRNYLEVGKFSFLKYYAKVELYILTGNYCHAINELHNLEHSYGVLPTRIYYPVLHLLERLS